MPVFVAVCSRCITLREAGSAQTNFAACTQLFLEALMLYSAGKPMMEDTAWDELKLKLKDEGSPIAVAVCPCGQQLTQLSASKFWLHHDAVSVDAWRD